MKPELYRLSSEKKLALSMALNGRGKDKKKRKSRKKGYNYTKQGYASAATEADAMSHEAHQSGISKLHQDARTAQIDMENWATSIGDKSRAKIHGKQAKRHDSFLRKASDHNPFGGDGPFD